MMGGEDFGWYGTTGVKCAFYNLGAMWPEPDKVVSLHNESVHFDESALETGVALYAQLALDGLEALNK